MAMKRSAIAALLAPIALAGCASLPGILNIAPAAGASGLVVFSIGACERLGREWVQLPNATGAYVRVVDGASGQVGQLGGSNRISVDNLPPLQVNGVAASGDSMEPGGTQGVFYWNGTNGSPRSLPVGAVGANQDFTPRYVGLIACVHR
jgi:hypothetical protein